MATINHRHYSIGKTRKFSVCFGKSKFGISNFFMIIHRALFIISCFLFCEGFLSKQSLDVMFVAILLLFVSNMIYAFLGFSKRLTYLLFLVSFFTFLMGRMTVDLFTKGIVTFNFSENINRHILLTLFISLVFLQFGFEGYELIAKNKVKNRSYSNVTYYKYVGRMQLYSLILFYLSAVCFGLENIEEWRFIQQNSYVASYYAYKSQIPRVIQIIGNMYNASFCVFLASYPSKKKCIVPMTVYIVLAVSILLTGARGGFVLNIAILVIYIFWRQYRDKEIWINRAFIVIGILMLPLLIAGLSYFVYIREGADVGEKTISAQFARFFRVAGRSVDIIGYGKKFRQDFPQRFYSLGEIVDYVLYSPILRFFSGSTKPIPYTVNYATDMHSYAHAITYLIDSNSYLTGHGKGSSYVAELYQDFGYIGIVIGNIIYGILLGSIYKADNENLIRNAILLISIHIVIYSPRGPMIYPLSHILNKTTVFVLVILWIGSKRIALNRINVKYFDKIYIKSS